ncbi:MAG TPA: penicillin-binding transpeptidase domain-containing protein [Streptosporangiaceae bacterium]|nr:penicillin-binding transpeptidase domain-containing protein [Streptosporangiaceae bacterium]
MIPASRSRLAVLYLVVAALLAVLGVRVWYIQARAGAAYAAQASAERIRQVIEPPVRGLITDDVGAPMVDSHPALVVSVSMPTLWKQSDGGQAELRRLARLLRISQRTMLRDVRMCTVGVGQPCWPGSPYQPIPVAQHVPTRLALQVLEDQRAFPGVTAGVQPVTHYQQPISTDLAQTLGYLQPITAAELKTQGLPVTGFSAVDLVGQAGLELEYDRQLRGVPGTRKLAVNAAGQVTGTLSQVRPRPGDYLVTSINAAVQRETESALAAAIARSQAAGNRANAGGAAVVMTTTGRVIAIASYPTYNPRVWTKGISQPEFRRLFGAADGEPILNRATQGQYAPGSTWKVTSVAAAVAAGYPLNGTYDCPAALSIGGRSYANDGSPSLGPMSFYTALVVSCDTVFYDLAYSIWKRDHPGANVVTSPHAPIQEMQKMEVAWGFGRYTGIDLPAENPGGVPTREWLYYLWKDNAHTGLNWCKYGRANGSYVQQIEYDDCRYGNVWTAGQAVIAAIGQGFVSVTPLQLARAYAALANGGTLYSPRIGEALLSPDGRLIRRITPPVAGHLPVARSTLAYIRSALAGVVTHGTAAGAFGGFPLGRVCVAGKTGTAEVAGNLATSVFASFAPCDHPRFVAVMMIPSSGYGADVSAPAIRQIWDAIYGLEGHKAALPGGVLPGLPHLNAAGQMAPPPGFGPAAGRPARHRRHHR